VNTEAPAGKLGPALEPVVGRLSLRLAYVGSRYAPRRHSISMLEISRMKVADCVKVAHVLALDSWLRTSDMHFNPEAGADVDTTLVTFI